MSEKLEKWSVHEQVVDLIKRGKAIGVPARFRNKKRDETEMVGSGELRGYKAGSTYVNLDSSFMLSAGKYKVIVDGPVESVQINGMKGQTSQEFIIVQKTTTSSKKAGFIK